jgi:trans-aconitate methyltransferase
MLTLQEINDRITKTPKGWHHTYLTDYYENIFSKHRNETFNILEIGIDKGQSMELWNLYFPNATIYGIDKSDTGYRPTTDKIKIRHGSSTKKGTYKNLPMFRFIIDDASHKIHNQVTTFSHAWQYLEKNGMYIIEDVVDIESSTKEFQKLHPSMKIYDLRLKKNIRDSVIVEFTK